MNLTSSSVSSWGVAALSSESFWEPCMASMFFLAPSRFFLCLWASFFTWPSALPELSLRTGLVSHFLSVFPGRLGPGELWGPRVWLEPGWRASLLDTDNVSANTHKTGVLKWRHHSWRRWDAYIKQYKQKRIQRRKWAWPCNYNWCHICIKSSITVFSNYHLHLFSWKNSR